MINLAIIYSEVLNEMMILQRFAKLGLCQKPDIRNSGIISQISMFEIYQSNKKIVDYVLEECVKIKNEEFQQINYEGVDYECK